MASVAFNSVSFTSHMLNLGYFSVLNDFSKTKKETKSNMQNLNGDYSGFGGLDRFAVKNQVDRNPEENILLRTSRFLKDTSGLTMRKKWSENEFTKFENNPELLKKYNTVYLERLNHLTSTLVSKGIYPVYLITPRSEKEQYEELLPLFAQLPARHKIEICDSRRYPELYTVENSLDETHLNAKGAKILTTILADQFSKLLKDSIR